MNDDEDIMKKLQKVAKRDCNFCWQKGENCDGDECEKVIAEKILNIYNRQQAEIERLQKTLDDVLDRQPLLVERLEKYAREEFAKLLKETDGYNNHTFDDCASIFISEEYRKGRDEKIKEIWNTIDEILAEMVDGMSEKNNKI